MGFPAPADRAKFRGPADRVKFRLANPRDVKALEPVIGPPLANPLREKPACPIRENPPPPARKAPPPPARKPPPPPAWKPPPPPRPPNPPPRGSAVPIEMASAKRESVAIEAARKYLGIATSRCRGPVGYRAHSLEPPAAAMVAVPRGEGTCDSLGCGILLPGNNSRTTILEPAVGPRSNTTIRELPVPTAVPPVGKKSV